MQSTLPEPAQELLSRQPLRSVKTAIVVDGGLGAYLAKDVVGNEDDCTTTAIYGVFSNVVKSPGEHGVIFGARLFNETENQAVQYDLHLFTRPPEGEVRDNWPNTNPIKTDKTTYIGKIPFPFTEANGVTVASTTEASPSTTGNLPKPFKCEPELKDIYFVLVTNTVYTQTAGDAIDITLILEQPKLAS